MSALVAELREIHVLTGLLLVYWLTFLCSPGYTRTESYRERVISALSCDRTTRKGGRNVRRPNRPTNRWAFVP
jgi:hypothetical protein